MRVEGSAWGGKFNTKRVQDKKTGNLNTPARDNTITTHKNGKTKLKKEVFNLRSFFLEL